jgi:hypothetical protein
MRWDVRQIDGDFRGSDDGGCGQVLVWMGWSERVRDDGMKCLRLVWLCIAMILTISVASHCTLHLDASASSR